MKTLVIENDNSSQMSSKRNKFTKKLCLLYTTSTLILGLVIGICLTYALMRNSYNTTLITQTSISEEVIRQTLFNHIDPKTIEFNLKKLTQKPITGETGLDDNTLFVYNKWTNLGLNTSFANYSVLMSYQNIDKPNLVLKYDKNDKLVNNITQFEDPLNASPEMAQYYRQNPPYLAYSPSTEVPLKSVNPVYINYGRAEDYDYLSKLNISVKGCVVIARYAKIFRANIVNLAELNGAIGVIIYSDPYDYTDGNSANTYPNSIYLPESGVQRGTIQIGDGDPQTPLYPSLESAYRLPVDQTNIPKIPAQSISYMNALYILEGLDGPEAPEHWKGLLNITYNIGPGYTDQSYLTLEVNTYLKQSVIHNVIATIEGCIEPDRYVLVGNHRDAWTFGAADPLSGTAVMLELSEAFISTMKKHNWCPRRSIVFCSWAAEEYGLIGSTEWVEENQKLLESQAIAYLNVDTAVEGNFTFQGEAVPLLYTTLISATKKVENPNQNEVKDGIKTVYDSYKLHRPSKNMENWPNIDTPGSGSDQSPFLFSTGVPVINIFYDCNKTQIKCYPLYHSMYETYEMMANLTDRGFRYSKALTQIWAEMLRSLSDSPVLPLKDSLRYYPSFLKSALKELTESQFNDILVKQNISLDYLRNAINEFEEQTKKLSERLTNLDQSDDLKLRRFNDIMMYLERSFIDSQGMPYRKDWKHIILAPSSLDSYSGTSFAGLYHIFREYTHESDKSKQNNLLNQFRAHLSVIIFHINSAKLLMKQTFN